MPWAPTCSSPMCSRIWATESPISAVGARERSTIPKGTPSRSAAMVPTSWPVRVTLKAAFLISSAISLSEASGPRAATARSTTPGPETLTLITQSGSSMPWKAPAMNGLSPTEFAKTTSFAQAIEPRSAVAVAQSLMTWPISRTAFMLIPAREDAMFTEEHTTSVSLSASGIDLTSRLSPSVPPFSTSAE